MVVFNQVGTRALILFKLLRNESGSHNMKIVVVRHFGKDIHLTGHVKVLWNESSLWNGYLGKSSQPVRDLVLMQVIPVGGVRLTTKQRKKRIFYLSPADWAASWSPLCPSVA